MVSHVRMQFPPVLCQGTGNLWTRLLRSATLQQGFSQELSARSSDLSECKRELELLYAEKLGPDDLKKRPDLTTKVDLTLRKCDAALTSFAGTMKSIKQAVES